MTILDTIIGMAEKLPSNNEEAAALSKSSGIAIERFTQLQEVYNVIGTVRGLRRFKHLDADINNACLMSSQGVRNALAEITGNFQRIHNWIYSVSDTSPLWQEQSSATFKIKVTESIKQAEFHLLFIEQQKKVSELLLYYQSLPSFTSLKEFNERLKDIDSKLQETRTAADQIAVDVLAKGETVVLGQLISDQRSQSSLWLKVLAGTIFTVLYLLVWASTANFPLFIKCGPIFPSPQPGDPASMPVYYAVSKLLIGAFALGCLVMVARLYQTYLHNLVVNQQRLVASDSFKKLNTVLGDADPSIRLKLVEVASRAILDHSSSGFLPTGTNEFTPLIQPLVEAAKGGK